MGCVYMATNMVNGKKYIGKTMKSLSSRKGAHISASLHGSQVLFHKAIRKYGVRSFDWNKVYHSKNEQELFHKEIEYIKLHKTKCPKGYNLTDGGEGATGYICSPEQRKRMSENRKGFKHTAEAKAKMGIAVKGRKLSEEHKKKVGLASKGRKWTD